VIVADDPDTRGDFWRTQPWIPLPAPSAVRPDDYRARRGRVGGGPAPRHPSDVHQRRPGCRDLPRPASAARPASASRPARRSSRCGSRRGLPSRRRGRRSSRWTSRGQHLRGRPAGSADHRDARIRLARLPAARDRRPVGVGVGGLPRRERRPRAVLAHERRRRADLPAPRRRPPRPLHRVRRRHRDLPRLGAGEPRNDLARHAGARRRAEGPGAHPAVDLEEWMDGLGLDAVVFPPSPTSAPPTWT
jgi:hypothetical protein